MNNTYARGQETFVNPNCRDHSQPLSAIAVLGCFRLCYGGLYPLDHLAIGFLGGTGAHFFHLTEYFS